MSSYEGGSGQPHPVGSSEGVPVLGLSIVHNGPREDATAPRKGRPEPRVIRRYVGGSLVQLGGDPMPAPKGGRRGCIEGYSPASRRRLMRALDTINQDEAGLPLFVTLTYPAEWPGSWHVWKRHLKAWLKRLKREHPGAWGVWRLEPQRRGAPHYHLLIWGARIEKQWCSRTWFEVVGSNDERHLRAGTQVAGVRSWRGVKAYTAKYLAKVVEDMPEGWDEGVGRWWGWVSQQRAPIQVLDTQLDERAFFQIRRRLWKLQEKAGLKPYKWSSFDLTGKRAALGASWRITGSDVIALMQWASTLDGERKPPSS